MLPFYGQLQIISTKPMSWTSLVVQWSRLHASTEAGMDLIPGQRTKIPHTAWLETHTHTHTHIHTKTKPNILNCFTL